MKPWNCKSPWPFLLLCALYAGMNLMDMSAVEMLEDICLLLCMLACMYVSSWKLAIPSKVNGKQIFLVCREVLEESRELRIVLCRPKISGSRTGSAVVAACGEHISHLLHAKAPHWLTHYVGSLLCMVCCALCQCLSQTIHSKFLALFLCLSRKTFSAWQYQNDLCFASCPCALLKSYVVQHQQVASEGLT